MTAALFAGACAAYAAAAFLYYGGRFVLALGAGAVFWGLTGAVVLDAMGPFGAAAAWILLAAGPALYLVVHAVDAKRGIFLLPTVYSIPLAFVAGLLLLGVSALALLF